ncbi:MAG: DUF2259 domain-containing protein [Aestuariivirgaceae bacterium]
MIKRVFAAFLALVSSVSIALAGDSAERRIIGFSPDGKWFAFEQFGIQDGSGYPYHDVFVIDLVNDKWALGTPVRVRIDTEAATQHQVRNQARSKAAPTLAKLKIIDQGRILASNPVTETASDARQIRFLLHMNVSGPKYQYRLKLEEFPASAEQLCKDLGADGKAFALSLAYGENPASEVYRDKDTVPKSRGCATGYTVADVVVAGNVGRPKQFVVLVHVFAYGFEGPDSRFIAIPVTAP